MRRRSDRRTRRFQLKLRRRALGVLAAGGLALSAGVADAAPPGWTVGPLDGSFDGAAIEAGVDLDIDGDGIVDFVLSGSDLTSGAGYGATITLSPQTVNTINNGVFANGDVAVFGDPASVLSYAGPVVAAPGSATLWDEDDFTDFESNAFVGLLFEIPGGSPHIGFLDLVIEADGFAGFQSLDIFEAAHQPVPEPAAGFLLAPLLGLLRRRR